MQTEQFKLDVLNHARQIVETSWCPFWSNHPDGIHHCALGALRIAAGSDEHDTSWLLGLTDPSARALYPELAGASAERRENGRSFDRFDWNPTVYVNNHLGRDAVLRVFDDAIKELNNA